MATQPTPDAFAREDAKRKAFLDKVAREFGEFFDSFVIIGSFIQGSQTYHSSRTGGNRFANDELIRMYADKEITFANPPGDLPPDEPEDYATNTD